MLNFKKILKCLSPLCLAAFLGLSLYFTAISGVAYAEDEEDDPPIYEAPETSESVSEETSAPSTESTTEKPKTTPSQTQPTDPPTTSDITTVTDDTSATITELTPPPIVVVPEMQLSFRETYLEVGQGVQLTASVINPPIPNPQISYFSSNTGVARVDNSGYIIATGVGRAEITAYWDNIMATATVTVTAATVTPEYIVISKTEFQLKIGAKAQIEAKLLPEEISGSYPMTYTSGNTEAVSVNENGLITALKAGEAYITVESAGISETVHVIVSDDIAYEHSKLDGYLYDTSGNPVSGVHIAIDSLTAITDNKGYFIFSEAEQRELTLTLSSDPAAACTVELTGDTTVYLLYEEGSLTRRSSYSELAGLLPISSAEFDTRFKNIVLTVGQVESLTYQYEPKDAVITEILYSSSNSLVAQIGQIDGVITAKSPGEAIITLSLNGGQAEAVCTITVNPAESTQYSILIMIVELVVFASVAAIVVVYYRKYKAKTESALNDEEDEDELHDID